MDQRLDRHPDTVEILGSNPSGTTARMDNGDSCGDGGAPSPSRGVSWKVAPKWWGRPGFKSQYVLGIVGMHWYLHN